LDKSAEEKRKKPIANSVRVKIAVVTAGAEISRDVLPEPGAKSVSRKPGLRYRE